MTFGIEADIESARRPSPLSGVGQLEDDRTSEMGRRLNLARTTAQGRFYVVVEIETNRALPLVEENALQSPFFHLAVAVADCPRTLPGSQFLQFSDELGHDLPPWTTVMCLRGKHMNVASFWVSLWNERSCESSLVLGHGHLLFVSRGTVYHITKKMLD